MTFKDKTLIRILLTVAKIISDPKWHRDIESLSNHITYGDREEKSK